MFSDTAEKKLIAEAFSAVNRSVEKKGKKSGLKIRRRYHKEKEKAPFCSNVPRSNYPICVKRLPFN
jgi:hypothetical protein